MSLPHSFHNLALAEILISNRNLEEKQKRLVSLCLEWDADFQALTKRVEELKGALRSMQESTSPATGSDKYFINESLKRMDAKDAEIRILQEKIATMTYEIGVAYRRGYASGMSRIRGNSRGPIHRTRAFHSKYIPS